MTEDNKTILANLAVTIGEKEESINKLTNRVNELVEQCNELNRKANTVGPDKMRRYFRCLDESDSDCELCPFAKECDIFHQHFGQSSLCHFMANVKPDEGKHLNLGKTYEELQAELYGAKDEITKLGKILEEKDAKITDLRQELQANKDADTLLCDENKRLLESLTDKDAQIDELTCNRDEWQKKYENLSVEYANLKKKYDKGI